MPTAMLLTNQVIGTHISPISAQENNMGGAKWLDASRGNGPPTLAGGNHFPTRGTYSIKGMCTMLVVRAR